MQNNETPYERCNWLDHKRSNSSPDGFRTIEDCDICQLRWVMPNIFDPVGTMPITIYRSVIFQKELKNHVN